MNNPTHKPQTGLYNTFERKKWILRNYLSSKNACFKVLCKPLALFSSGPNIFY